VLRAAAVLAFRCFGKRSLTSYSCQIERPGADAFRTMQTAGSG
jgi:hypothetical protein